MRILKRYFTTDGSGRIIASNTERLTEDGGGNVHLTSRHTALRCSGCLRPLTDVSQARGRCDYCGIRGCCTECIVKCQACSRRLCGRCRRSFVGNTTNTVCPTCAVKLQRRQVYIDRVNTQKLHLQYRMQLRREQTRLDALRLQAMRMRQSAQLAAIREANRARMAGMQARNHAIRYLHR